MSLRSRDGWEGEVLAASGLRAGELTQRRGDTEENGLRVHRRVAEIAEVRGEANAEFEDWGSVCGLGRFEEAENAERVSSGERALWVFSVSLCLCVAFQ